MKRMVRGFAAGVAALALSGCGFASFAPPEVSLTRRSPERSIENQCQLAPNSGDELPENVDGALRLVGNFVDGYRCAMRQAADGRQAFQVPGFLALSGAATATALGGGRRWSVIGGAASAMFGAGNSYYDSVTQTAVLSDALEALDCIQMAAVGFEAYERLPRVQRTDVPSAELVALRNAVAGAQSRVANATQALEAAQFRATESRNLVSSFSSQQQPTPEQRAERGRREEEARAAAVEERTAAAEQRAAHQVLERLSSQLIAAEGEVSIDVQRQYFHMISAALLDVEVIAAQRLAARGTPFDGTAVAAQIAALAREEAEAKGTADADPSPPQALVTLFGAPVARAVNQAQMRLAEMRPRLQQCIARARA